jgi:hypothetical protein
MVVDAESKVGASGAGRAVARRELGAMARFFIDRPIFAWVIAIVIMLAGALSIQQLPVSQYPSIAPPAIVINASYPGASAKAVEDSVTQIIEQKMTGLDGLLYMSVDQRRLRQRLDHADLLRRHRPGHRPGAGAEQAADWRCRCCRRSCSSRACRSPSRRATS